MKVTAAFPDIVPADYTSDLPPGGSPDGDDAYLDWVRAFIEEVAPAVLDSLTGPDGEVAGNPEAAVNVWKLTSHLYKWLIGWPFPSGTGPNYNHRLRFVSVQFALRRPAVVAEADRYVWAEVGAIRNRHEASAR